LNKIFFVLFLVSVLILFGSQQAYASTFFVEIINDSVFDQDTLTIALGDTISWNNQEEPLSADIDHPFTPTPLFPPTTIPVGGFFEFTFNDEGVFTFRVSPIVGFPPFGFIEVTVTDDFDGDGVPNDEDICPGFDDNIDTDGDGVPDGCDPNPTLSCGPGTSKLNFMCIIDTIVAAITLAGNVLITGSLQVVGDITSPTISNMDQRVGDLESQFLNPTLNCSGTAACIPGYVTANIDGDTIKVYGKSVRFALIDAPESGEAGFSEASDFIANACPVGSFVVIDEDDGQTGGSFGRIIGVVHCNGMNLNEVILDSGLATLATAFCSASEFETHAWAQRHGC